MLFWFRFMALAGILHSPTLLWCQPLQWKPKDTLDIFFNQSVSPVKADNLGHSFLKDSRGFVWLSSFEGLVRFDGLQWVVYPPRGFQDSTAATRTVGSNVGSRFFEDKNGDIWFSTETAINRYEQHGGQFLPLYLPSSSGLGHDPHLLFLEQKRFLWATFDQGQVFRYDLTTRCWDDQRVQLPSGHIIVPDTNAQGDLVGWFSHPAAGSKGMGLTYTSIQSTGTPPALRHFLNEHIIHDLAATPEFTFVATDKGLWKISLLTGEAECYMAKLGGIECIEPDRSGAFWLLSQKSGLWRWDGHYTHAPQPVHLKFHPSGLVWRHHASQLHTDQDGVVWAVYNGQGLAFAQPEKSKFWHQDLGVLARARPGLRDGRISCLSEGTGQGVLVVFDNQAVGELNVRSGSLTWHTLIGDGTGGLVIFQCYKHSDGAMYLATTQGIFRRNGDSPTWQLLRPKESKTPMVFWLFAHSDGRMLGTSGTSVLEVRPEPQGKVGFRVLHKGLCEKMMVFGSCDRQGNLFLNADDTHVTIVRPSGQRQRLALPSFWGVVQDKKTLDLYWFATATGLYGIDLRTLTMVDVVNAEGGLPNQYLYHLTQSNDGDLWASTSNGLFRYTHSTRKLRVFSVEDGLGENAFVEKSLLILPQTQYVVAANLDQINFARLANIGESSFMPPVNITNIKINDEVFENGNPSAADTLRLQHSQNTVSLGFVGIDYSAPLKVRLQYRLSNYDAPDHWVAVPPGTPGFIRYANLPPGQYQLQIMAANSDGVWSEQVKTLDINILPPWWQTTWFRALAIAVLVLGAYGFYRYRMGQLRRRLEQRNRMTLLELDALRAQLNPHFISNSLVAINHYIRNNGVERVRQYVNTLARLMRDVLASARHLLVSVDDELAMLRNYIEVESGQFPQAIDFEIVVADGIPTDEIQMPGMLLQPFVENAIRHGLKPRQGQGSIRIEVQAAPQSLIFIINDDGVGRQHKPQEEEEEKNGTRTSHGLDITRQRLQLYDQYQQTAAHSDFDITDLRGPNGEAAGTAVRLRLFLPKKSGFLTAHLNTTFAA